MQRKPLQQEPDMPKLMRWTAANTAHTIREWASRVGSHQETFWETPSISCSLHVPAKNQLFLRGHLCYSLLSMSLGAGLVLSWAIQRGSSNELMAYCCYTALCCDGMRQGSSRCRTAAKSNWFWRQNHSFSCRVQKANLTWGMREIECVDVDMGKLGPVIGPGGLWRWESCPSVFLAQYALLKVSLYHCNHNPSYTYPS